jgi:hypothetical protein
MRQSTSSSAKLFRSRTSGRCPWSEWVLRRSSKQNHSKGPPSVLYGGNWADAKDDETIYKFFQDMIDELDNRAKKVVGAASFK